MAERVPIKLSDRPYDYVYILLFSGLMYKKEKEKEKEKKKRKRLRYYFLLHFFLN